jgi:hypothetical protein
MRLKFQPHFLLYSDFKANFAYNFYNETTVHHKWY